MKSPERERPTDEQFFYANNKPNVAFLRRHFHAEGKLHESQAIYILEKAKEIFSQEPNVLDLDAPITSTLPFSKSHRPPSELTPGALVCGDIHGQYVSTLLLISTYQANNGIV